MSKNAALVAMIVAAGEVLPFAVVAKRTMWRGGRHWSAGVHVFDTEEKLAELGTADQVETMLSAVARDTGHFEIQPATRPPTGQQQQQELGDEEKERLAAEAEARRVAEAEEKLRAEEAKWTRKYEGSAKLKEEFPTVEAYIAAQRAKQD